MERITYDKIREASASLKTTAIKGKEYAEVNQRVKVFRMLFPMGCISTDIVNADNGMVVMKANVYDEEGKLLSTGTAYEKEGSSNINRTSYIENCETSAIGRALGFLGIGIDTSIATYEEVATAILQQEEKASELHIKALLETAKQKGVTEEQLCKRYNLKKITDMLMTDYSKCAIGLQKMADVDGN
jgi:hypothetical protein